MNDYLTNEDGTFSIKNGDFEKGQSEAQDMGRIINSNKGEWKQFPVLGAALIRNIKANVGMDFINKEIETNLRSDGFTKVTFKDNNIDATRE
jgi:hypothetical protein